MFGLSQWCCLITEISVCSHESRGPKEERVWIRSHVCAWDSPKKPFFRVVNTIFNGRKSLLWCCFTCFTLIAFSILSSKGQLFVFSLMTSFFKESIILKIQKHFRLYYTKLKMNCAAVTSHIIFNTRNSIKCIQRHAHLMSNLMKRETSWNHTHIQNKRQEKLSCLHTQVLLDRSSSSLNVFQYDPSHPQRWASMLWA